MKTLWSAGNSFSPHASAGPRLASQHAETISHSISNYARSFFPAHSTARALQKLPRKKIIALALTSLLHSHAFLWRLPAMDTLNKGEPEREDVANKLFVILCVCLFRRSKQSRSPEPSISTAGSAGAEFSVVCVCATAKHAAQPCLCKTCYRAHLTIKAEGWRLITMQCKFLQLGSTEKFAYAAYVKTLAHSKRRISQNGGIESDRLACVLGHVLGSWRMHVFWCGYLLRIASVFLPKRAPYLWSWPALALALGSVAIPGPDFYSIQMEIQIVGRTSSSLSEHPVAPLYQSTAGWMTLFYPGQVL